VGRTLRKSLSELTESWPIAVSDDPIGEVARLFARNVRAGIGEKSIRSVATASGLSHVTLLAILEGRVWPDLATIARLERGLDAELWPGRASGV
jgi:transcriptional regulator with XRE-family HTH domain